MRKGKARSSLRGLTVTEVVPGSIADHYHLRPGDCLIRINDEEIHDPIDYRFYESEEEVLLEIERDTARIRLPVRKGFDEDLGLQFTSPSYRTCRNRCIFCFVHQMPPGLRRSLYIQDDDFRLSFLHGNYITLTNFSEGDFQRIFRQRLSPLYVSVHATDDAVRRRLLGNPNAPPILPALRRLVENGIHLHTQIVLCPDINDGKILDQTIQDLEDLYPSVESVAVVPAGQTRFRRHLEPLRPVHTKYAKSLLRSLHAKQMDCLKRLGEAWVFPSDELYLKAVRSFPPLERYGSLPQLENGVGMVPLLLDGVARKLEHLAPGKGGKKITIGTGLSAYPILETLLDEITSRTGVCVDLVPIRNRFFGASVTVSGLITGHDILQTFLHRKTAEPIYLPASMLQDGEWRFLDGLKVSEVEQKLQYRLQFVEPSADGLFLPFHSG
jgi:putative radical SAM enzyme (TIGR03279 family)